MRRKASGAPRNSTEFDLKKDMDQDVIWGMLRVCNYMERD
jgi:hypothetical protein